MILITKLLLTFGSEQIENASIYKIGGFYLYHLFRDTTIGSTLDQR